MRAGPIGTELDILRGPTIGSSGRGIFSIVALQEVCWIGAEEVREYKRLGCRIYQSRGKKKRLGTAFIVLGEMLDRVIGWTPITDRMCVLRVKGRFFNISIINVHSPHSGSEDDEKDVGQEEEFRPVIGKFSAHVRTNENGLRLIDFATSKNMAVRSTCFQHNLRDKYTWRSPQGTESQIDHVVIDGRHFSDIIDVRTYRGANVDSDHYLVMVKMRQRLSLAKSVRYRRPPRLDLERLKLPEVASRYAHSLEAALPGRAAITNAAESTIGFVERGRRNDWFDEECRAILEEKNAARRAMLQYNLRDYEEAYGQKRRQQHQLFREKVRHHEELEFEDMEQLHRSNETRKFYKKLNGSRQGFTPRVEMCRDKDGVILTDEREVIDRWKQHFDEHLNGTEAEAGVQDGRREDYIGAAGEGVEPVPTLREGDKLDCENYRAITILNAAYKVFSQILFSRLSPIAEDFVGSYQAGFVVGRSTTDQIFTVRQILQKCREYQVPTHHLFIDFKAAYDSVDREELWKIMDENGFPGKLIRLTRMTMDGSRCCVKISGAESDSFPSLGGLRQGDGISCLCFNVALEGVLRRAGFNMRGTIFSKSNQFICYADDMDIVGRTLKAVADAYTGLKRVAEKCSIYKSLIRPVVLYGHETWTMLEEDLRALSVFERRVLRTIFGGVFGNDGWRRRMNHELAQLYNEPSIRKVAKAGRLQWAGHVARMPERPEQLSQRNQRINPAKLVFVSEPVGTRRRGVQRARWVDQVENDLERVSAPQNWRQAAMDRACWRRIVQQAKLMV
ncbi:uncharacterized protein LOC119769343 [Culex quinquefasciatus]|uniref:uncharacterized protein LOC119769343 n=1 Tax=Culex quinquefasciatus TaxID=7176 RepID=UPI0018E31035|nr:uncharacterized protein LOC119769343 [Culex quinquefasciatus]